MGFFFLLFQKIWREIFVIGSNINYENQWPARKEMLPSSVCGEFRVESSPQQVSLSYCHNYFIFGSIVSLIYPIISEYMQWEEDQNQLFLTTNYSDNKHNATWYLTIKWYYSLDRFSFGLKVVSKELKVF